MTSSTNGVHYDIDFNNTVMALDPLHFDNELPKLCEMNARADLRGLTALLRDLIPPSDQLAEFSTVACHAAMRDLGMLLGSVKRHGAEPVEAVPEVEPVLLELGRRTDMIPRDTIHHYITWNPTFQVRERMYTGKDMERALLSATRVSIPSLSAAVEIGQRMTNLSPYDAHFTSSCNELAELLEALEKSIDIVSAKVSPEFFGIELRPYFEDVRVAGTRYKGPAAAHAPLWLIDLALWASDHGNETYEAFWRESAQHALPSWRELYQVWAKGPSVVTRILSEFGPPETSAPDTPVPTALRKSAEALRRALRALIVFRGKHMVVARGIYADHIRLYDYGSGGGNPELLKAIIDLTRENARYVRDSLAKNTGHPQPV